MNPLVEIIPVSLTVRLGWTLLHFLWQGSIIALLLAGVLWLLRRQSAQRRYLAGCGALGLMALLSVATFFFISPGDPPLKLPVLSVASVRALPHGVPLGTALVPAGGLESKGPLDGWESLLPWLSGAWFVGVCVMSVRFLGGLRHVCRLRREALGAVADPWLVRLNDLKHRLGVSRPVRLLESARIEVPTVIGWLKPMILLPASTLTGLAPAQIESILAHELAHIRRHDYLVNLCQRVIETLLFYHPAVWWVSRCIRIERENCCDDLAVSVCGDRAGFARALARLEELRFPSSPLALAATDGPLLRRIRRVLAHPPSELAAGSWKMLLALALIVLGLTAWIGSKHLLTPRLFAAEVRLVIERPEMSSLPDNTAANDDPAWMQAELARLTSRENLYQVIDTCQLTQRLAERLGKPEVSRAEAYDRLRQRVETSLSRDTGLVELRVVSEEPDEAAAIANALAEFYQTARQRDHEQNTLRAMQLVQAQLDRERAEGSARKTALEVAREHLSRVGSFQPDGTFQLLASETRRSLERRRAEVRMELQTRQSVLRGARSVPPEKRAETFAASPGTQDDRLNELLARRDAEQARQTGLSFEYGAEHPFIVGSKGIIQTLETQIQARLEGILAGLEMEVARHTASLKTLEGEMESLRQQEEEALRLWRPYEEARQAYEAQRRTVEALELRLRQEEANARLAIPHDARILDRAEPPLNPQPRRWFAR